MATQDLFRYALPSVDGPSRHNVAIVNDVAFVVASRGIYVGVSGDIQLTDVDGNTTTFKGVPQGVILPVRATIVIGAGTTATNLVGMS